MNLKIIVISLTAGILIFTGYLASFNLFKTPPQLIACTMEAKLCPDGSAVGRTGPNCEFVECPKLSLGQVDVSGWKTYRNEKYGFEVRYPNNWGLDEINTPDAKINYNNVKILQLFELLSVSPSKTAPNFEIYAIPNPGHLSFDVWFKKYIDISTHYTANFTSTILPNGDKAYLIDINPGTVDISLFIEKSKDLFIGFNVDGYSEADYPNEFQILKSFKFLK